MNTALTMKRLLCLLYHLSLILHSSAQTSRILSSLSHIFIQNVEGFASLPNTVKLASLVKNGEDGKHLTDVLRMLLKNTCNGHDIEC